MRFVNDTAKRAFDLLAALAGLLLLPVLLVLAVLVRLLLGRPVLFCQTRPGLRGKPFTLYKFRTMADACDPEGAPAARLRPTHSPGQLPPKDQLGRIA